MASLQRAIKAVSIDSHGALERVFAAYQLVHEWAHFRYGVFDEYGDPESDLYPSLYCESGMVRATSCSDRAEFTAYTDSGEPCRIYKGCRASSKCKVWFSPESEDPLKSSIMFMPYMKGVSDFCDDVDMKHNAFAPTKHNHLCGRRSTWDVIRSNEDFTNLPKADLGKDVKVNFKEVQKKEGYFRQSNLRVGRLIEYDHCQPYWKFEGSSGPFPSSPHSRRAGSWFGYLQKHRKRSV